jgi:thiol-disulfide isomerase/thioredoxin
VPSLRRNIIEWIILIAAFAILYLTGWYVPVAAKLQQLVLATGIISPESEVLQKPIEGELIFSNTKGKIFSLSDKSGKVVFVNFWASWCPPCLAEMPNINQLYQDYADNDEVVFLMISVEDNFEKSKALVKRKGFDFQIYHVESLNLPAIYKGTLPTTFLLSKDGKVLMQHEGMANYDNEQTRTLIKKALDD